MQRWTGGKKQKKKKGNVLEYCYLVDARSIRRVGLRSEIDQYQLESGGLTCRLEVVDFCYMSELISRLTLLSKIPGCANHRFDQRVLMKGGC